MNIIDLVAVAHQQLRLNIQSKRKKLVIFHTSKDYPKRLSKHLGIFHKKKKPCSIVTTLRSVLSIEDVNMRVNTEIITNSIRGNEGILIGTKERPD